MSRPRIRSLKPECWQDEAIGALSMGARLLFVGLITMADDEGRFRAQPSMLLGQLFPWDDVPPRKLADWLTELDAGRLIVRYEIEGKPYGAFRNWRRHQRINRPTVSELPQPPFPEVVAANSCGDSVNEPTQTQQDVHGTDATICSTPFTPSYARGSDRIGKEGKPPQPPEQARGEQGHSGKASPRANSRALGTNPRTADKRHLAAVAAERCSLALAALTEPNDEQRADWERLKTALHRSVSVQTQDVILEPLLLAAVEGSVLVIDGPDGAMTFAPLRLKTALTACCEDLGVEARFASHDEHDGLSGEAA